MKWQLGQARAALDRCAVSWWHGFSKSPGLPTEVFVSHPTLSYQSLTSSLWTHVNCLWVTGCNPWSPFNLSDQCPPWCECSMPCSPTFWSSSVNHHLLSICYILTDVERSGIRDECRGRLEQDAGFAFKAFIVKLRRWDGYVERRPAASGNKHVSDEGCAALVPPEVSVQFLVGRLKDIFT